MSAPGIFRVPPPANEPVRDYAPGSPERASLQLRLEQMKAEHPEIPCVIGGEDVRTGNLREAVMPHDKDHVLADVHQGGAAEVERAVEAAADAWEDWHRVPWEERAAVFLRAAELLAGPWRDTLNAATMLGQSKTAHQAEIDAACELIDFWRFNPWFMTRIYEEQPFSGPGNWNRMEYRPLEGFVFAVSPFNFTAIGGNLSASPALMGNTVIWKPASTAMLSAYYTMRIFQEAGLPDLQRYLAVPMIAGDETVAVLGVANREAGYGEEDQRHLSSLSDGVWRVLQSKRAHAATLGSLQRTDVAMQGMIDSMVRMVERHDPYTAGSARRLAALAVALGREAGLDGERQHALRVAALLHDIGNIAVPPSILSKPSPLTETELAIMRTHVDEGCQLLAEIDFGAPIADIIYQSHERYDGSGYPRGLKGEEILVEARILAIADTVEALCSPRPYRPAAGMEAAIDTINRGAGRLYDLHLVAACTRLVRQHGFTLPE